MREFVTVKPLDPSDEDETRRSLEKKAWTRPRLRRHRVETSTLAGIVVGGTDAGIYS